MPDRAVVDDDRWTRWMERNRAEAVEEYKASQPRALVAISEDRHWLVSILPGQASTTWTIYEFVDKWPYSYEWHSIDHAEDTGQDAHEVLAAFLKERNGD